VIAMANDEYELIPHKEIVELKKEIQGLKEQLRGKTETGDSQKTLMDSINELITVFKEATEELRKKPEPADTTSVLIKQNEIIAKGILALADIMNEHLPQISKNTQMAFGQTALGQKPVPTSTTRMPGEVTITRRPIRTIPGFDDTSSRF